MSVLEVKDLRKSYKKGFIPKQVEVLKGLDFSLEQGSITGFLGGNGAGKTTTMKCILGLAHPDSGEINFFGQGALTSELKRRIGFLPERPYFYDYLTGQEFLEFYGSLAGLKKSQMRERINELLKKVDLVHARDRKLKGYSKGMLQKIGMAQALIHDPEFVILDEPMSGLDPDGRMYLSQLINEVASSGKTVFFSSHLLHDAERLCKDLVILKDGKTIYRGTTEALLNRLGNETTITYLHNNKKDMAIVKDIKELQEKLDYLRQQSANILDIRQNRNLEKAFTEIGLRDKNL